MHTQNVPEIIHKYSFRSRWAFEDKRNLELEGKGLQFGFFHKNKTKKWNSKGCLLTF